MSGYACVGLVSPKIESNVGGAMRAAFCYGASLVVVQGPRYKRQVTDTQKAYRSIPTLVVDDIWSAIPYDCVPVAVELVEGSQDLRTFVHPKRAMYIFGPEDGNVPRTLIEKCPLKIMIPTRFCMNLAATANVVLYDRLAKS